MLQSSSPLKPSTSPSVVPRTTAEEQFSETTSPPPSWQPLPPPSPNSPPSNKDDAAGGGGLGGIGVGVAAAAVAATDISRGVGAGGDKGGGGRSASTVNLGIGEYAHSPSLLLAPSSDLNPFSSPADPRSLEQHHNRRPHLMWDVQQKRALRSNFQGAVYNFLERPTGWKCFLYHFSV